MRLWVPRIVGPEVSTGFHNGVITAAGWIDMHRTSYPTSSLAEAARTDLRIVDEALVQ